MNSGLTDFGRYLEIIRQGLVLCADESTEAGNRGVISSIKSALASSTAVAAQDAQPRAAATATHATRLLTCVFLANSALLRAAPKGGSSAAVPSHRPSISIRSVSVISNVVESLA